MLGHLYETQDCSVARSLELIGERWSLLILRDAVFVGHTRFNQFMTSLEIAPNILAKRLSGFVDCGLMELTVEGDYRLTRKGRELKPVLVALALWGDKWVRPGPIAFVETGTGKPVNQAFLGGRRELDVDEVAAIPRASRTS